MISSKQNHPRNLSNSGRHLPQKTDLPKAIHFLLFLHSSGNHLTTMQSQKRKRFSKDDLGRDRLTEMPDEVLVNILTYLPTLDAVRTVLLRPFGNLWTMSPSLYFVIDADFLENSRENDDYKSFYFSARNALMLHKRPSIEKLDLCVHSANYGVYGEPIPDVVSADIEACLSFALNKQAKEIKFRFMSDHFYSSSLLPEFTSHFLVTLELSDCRIDPPFQVKLGSLKKLVFSVVVIYEEAFEQFISGCPSLQELFILSPYGMETLSFSAPNIHKLSLIFGDNNPYYLDFPNLKSLEFDIQWLPEVINVSSVRDIYLKNFMAVVHNDDELAMFNTLLGKFEGSEIFQLSRAAEWFLHFLNNLHFLQLKWKRVVQELGDFCESCLVGISELLGSLKYLEELIICTALKGAKEVELLKRVSSFKRASTNAKVFFV